MLRTVLPHLLRLLPLLEGNVGTAVSNLLTPPQAKLPPPVDLKPIEDGLAGLDAANRGLGAQVSAQNELLERFGGRLKALEDATARNTLTQRKLLEELDAMGGKLEESRLAGRKAGMLGKVALGLLALSILLDVAVLVFLRGSFH